jgi:hypothetical protein
MRTISDEGLEPIPAMGGLYEPGDEYVARASPGRPARHNVTARLMGDPPPDLEDRRSRPGWRTPTGELIDRREPLFNYKGG